MHDTLWSRQETTCPFEHRHGGAMWTKRCATPGKAGGFRYGSRPRRLGGRFAAFRSRLKAAFASLKRLEELQLV